MMPQRSYSFAAQSNITVLTQAQLNGLIQERRERGTSDDCLAEFTVWHQTALEQ